MTNRIVSVVLRGNVTGFVGSMRAASAGVASVTNQMTANTRQAGLWRQNLTAVGDSAGKIGLVAAAGVGLAVRAFANFDQAMSNVAATGQDARASIDQLRQAAIDFGASTQFSATEAAAAIENLAKAGVSASDILGGGLKGALDLAAAGQLEVADAAEYASIAMTQFGLSGEDVPHIADLLAAGAGKANGEVTDLAMALNQAGLIADQTGLSIEETTAGLAAFASAGLLGSDSGTSFKTMLQALTPSSDKAAAAIEKYNLSAYDAKGQFIGLEKFAGKLKTGLSGLTAEQRNATLKTIYGSDAIRAASVLYDQGAEGIANWTQQVNDQGYAAETAAIKMDNLKGDLEQLGGAFETALIGSGEGANGPLRETVQLLTAVVNGYNAMPGPLKAAATGGLALTAALGGTVFIASRAISAIASTRQSLTGLGASFGDANKKALALRGGAAAAGLGLAALSGPAHEANDTLGDLTDVAAAAALGFAVGGPWGAAIGGGIGLITAFGGANDTTAAAVAGVTATLDAQTGAITANTAQWVVKQLQDRDAVDGLESLGISLSTATDAALGNADAWEEVRAVWNNADGDQKKALETLVDVNNERNSATLATKESTAATEGSVEAQKLATEQAGTLGGATAELTEEQKALNEANQKTADSFIDLSEDGEEAKRSLGEWIEDLAKQADALNDFADNAAKAGKRGLEDGLIAELQSMGPAGAARLAELADASDAELERANRAWRRGQRAIRNYVEEFGEVPEEVETKISTPGLSSASARLGSLLGQLSAVSGTYKAVIDVSKTGANLGVLLGQLDKARGRAHGGAILRAEGGSVLGPGTGTSDSIPAIGPGGVQYRLSNGEHVLTAADVDAFGGQAAVYAMRAALHSQQRSFASGGGVNVPSSIDLNGGGIAAAIASETGRAVSKAFYGASFQILPDGSVRAKQMGA